MDFGLISDRDLVPDLWHLVDLHIAEVERLFDATGATRASPQAPPAMRHGGDGVAPIGAPTTVTRPRRQPTRTNIHSSDQGANTHDRAQTTTKPSKTAARAKATATKGRSAKKSA